MLILLNAAKRSSPKPFFSNSRKKGDSWDYDHNYIVFLTGLLLIKSNDVDSDFLGQTRVIVFGSVVGAVSMVMSLL